MPKIEQRPFRALLILVTVKIAVLISLAYTVRFPFAPSPTVGAATSLVNDPALVKNGDVASCDDLPLKSFPVTRPERTRQYAK
jgi:hypothetical protein